MASKRTTFVVDIHDFVLYLEECFYRSAFRFPWLLDNQPIELHWLFVGLPQEGIDKTQRDYLIDWIVRRVLVENYYIDLCYEEPAPEFEAVFNHLQTSHDFHRQCKLYFNFPLLVGDIHPHRILRYRSWLYVDMSYNPDQQLRHHALRPSHAVV